MERAIRRAPRGLTSDGADARHSITEMELSLDPVLDEEHGSLRRIFRNRYAVEQLTARQQAPRTTRSAMP